MSNILPEYITSGSNPDTYFQYYPDTDDPIGYPCRGYYFDGIEKYLSTKVEFVIPQTFVIYMWVLPQSGVIFSKGDIAYLECDSISLTFSINCGSDVLSLNIRGF